MNNKIKLYSGLVLSIQEMSSRSAAPVAQESKKSVIGQEEWETRLSKVDLSAVDLNKLVMNYLVVEGYKDAAELFAKEAGIPVPIQLGAIEERMAIRNLIQAGEVESAIDRINRLDPDILECQPDLLFRLRLQQLIELIKEGRVQEALDFSREELAMRCEAHPHLLGLLEQAMLLLAWDNPIDSKSELLTPAYRVGTANLVNGALLAAQQQEQESRLPQLLRVLDWAQQQLSERVTFPCLVDPVQVRFSESK